MDGINKTIYEELEKHLKEYDLKNDRELIKLFLSTTPEHSQTRNDLAIELTNRILSRHGKGDPLPLQKALITLADIEKQIMPLHERARDHVAHSLTTYLLGIYLNEKLSLHISKLEWKLCGLLHDIGYPFEMALNLPKKYEKEINLFGKKRRVFSPPIKSHWTISNLEKLTGNNNSLDLISDRLQEWNLRILPVVRYNNMEDTGLNHGILSSMLIIKQIDILYNRFNPQRILNLPPQVGQPDWSQMHFYEHIVNACSAIFLHNLEDRFYHRNKLNISNQPLPFLMKLSDELQDWDRPGNSKRKMYTAKEYNISVYRKRINLYIPKDRSEHFRKIRDFFSGIKISLPEDRKKNRKRPIINDHISRRLFEIN